jgi:DNA-binding Lrp family transcriptional regulator
MPTAYVLINCRLGKEAKIITELRALSGVAEADGVYGLYDILARITMDKDEELETVLRNIRRIEHIVSTNTLIKIEGQG